MRQLTDEVGLVCAIPYCARLDNFAAHVEAAIINGPHARMLFLASACGQGHGVGKIMLFRRCDFLRAGGFDAIAHTVGEDNAMAKAHAANRAAHRLLAPAGAAGTRLAGISATSINGNCAGASSGATTSFCPSCWSRSARRCRRYRRRAGRAADRAGRRFAGFAATFRSMVRAGDTAFHRQRMAVILGGAGGFRCPRGGDARGLAARLDDHRWSGRRTTSHARVAAQPRAAAARRRRITS